MNTGQRIREKRLSAGMTQEELAENCAISARTIQRIENGETDPRSYTLKQIAKALGVDEKYFIEDIEIRNKSNIWLILLHISSIVPIVIPALVIWLANRDHDPEMDEHGKEVVNFQISMAILLFLSSILIIIIIGIFTNIALGLMCWAYAIINTIKAAQGDPLNYPRIIRLIS